MDWTHSALELRSKTVIEEKIEGKRRRQRRRKKLRDDLRERRRYWTLKEEALHCIFWRTRFGKAMASRKTVYVMSDLQSLSLRMLQISLDLLPFYFLTFIISLCSQKS